MGDSATFADSLVIQSYSYLSSFISNGVVILEDGGNDVLTGSNYDDKLLGGAGDDGLYGGLGNDNLYGGDGDDSALEGEWGDDEIYGELGNDKLDGGSGNDRLFGGEGIDLLEGGAGNDRLEGGKGNDKDAGAIKGGLFGGFGDDLLIAELNDGDDDIDGGLNGIDLPIGDGTDTIVYKYAQGDSTIKIIEGAWFSGQTAADFGISITGAKDSTGATGTFGNDTLTSIEKGAVEAGSGTDTLVLDGKSYYGYLNYIDLGTQGSGFAAYDVLDASRVTGGIKADLRKATDQNLVVDDGIIFDSTLKLRNVENVIGSSYDDEIYGVSGTSGSRILGGSGRDKIYGGDQGDDLQGGTGDDILIGGGGADSLDGGTGADILVTDGLDSIARGDVEDRLYWKNYSETVPTSNRLRGGVRTVVVNDDQTRDEQIQAMLNSTALYEGELGEKYEVTGSGASQGLRITMKSGEVFSIANWAEGEYGIILETTKRRDIKFNFMDYQVAGFPSSLFAIGTLTSFIVNTVRFTAALAYDPAWGNFSGDRFTLTQLRTWANQPGQPPRSNTIDGTNAGEAVNGRMGDDRILGRGGDDTIDGLAGDDFIDGGDGNDLIRGGIGADRLEGGAGDDVLDGSVGNDTLITGAGKDIVIVRSGDGADTVIADVQDIIRFEGVNSTDVTTRTGGGEAGIAPQYGAISSASLALSFGADKVTIQGAAFGSVEFADGVVQTAAVMARKSIAAATTGGNDTIIGFGTADRLAGGAGNDYLNGLAGNDRYYFAIGDGQDRIEDSAGFADRIIFGPGITPANLVVTTSQIASGSRAGETLARFAISGTSDWVEFVVRDIEEVRFADGTIWNRFDIGSRVYGALGTAGDDRIRITNTINGQFRPGAGSDVVTAGQYATAQILFGAGAQLDRIELSNTGSAGGRAIANLDSNLSVGDLRIQRLGDGLSFTINGTSDRLEIARYYDSTIQADWRTFDISLGTAGITLGTAILEQIADVDAGIVQRNYGTSGVDNLVGLASGDWLSGGAGNDTITGNDGADLLFGGVGDDIINGGADRDILIGEAGNDTLDGGTGDDMLFAGAGTDILIGGAGNDGLTGNGQSTLTGGTGNDRITSTTGDVIVYNLGDGADTLLLAGGTSTLDGSLTVKRTEISLGAGITAATTTLTLEGWAIYVNINGSSTDRLRLDRMFQGANLPQIRFADGTIWRETEILGKLFNPNNSDDSAMGIVSQAPDWANRDLAYVYGGAGNDTLSDQATPVFYAAELRYLFAPGSGNDVIPGLGRTGKLMLYGFDPDQMSIARSGSGLGDFTLSFSGTTDTIKINGQQQSNGASIITDFVFSGAYLYSDDIRKRYLAQVSTGGNDTITGFDGVGGVQDVGIIPGQTYFQNPGNDRLQGGLGNDLMVGGSGDDTYVVNIGDGVDTIRDISLFNAGAGAGYDALLTNALSTNAIFRRSTLDTNDLVITFSNSSDQITIDEFYAQGAIEEFEFGDGVVLSALDVEQLALAGSVTGGNDMIRGSASPETLTGGAGNDILDGLAGSDRYLFKLGDGQDVVTDSGTAEANTLAFGLGIIASQVVFQKVGSDLKAIVNANDSVTVTNQFGGAAVRPIGQAVFADGTRKSAVEIDQLVLAQMATSGNDGITGFASDDMIAGGAGNDVLNGGAGDDVINGGLGNDTLDGQQGTDIYVIARGDGNDIIASTGDGSALDVVRFADGLGQRDLLFTRPTPTSPDLVISVRGTSQQITVSNYFNGLAVKQFEFADGSSMSVSDVTAALANAAPSASGQAWRMIVKEGGRGRVALPDGLFADDGAADQLVYKASLAGGEALPPWLTFDGRIFEANANDGQVGTFAIKLTAIDRFGASFDRIFQLDVLDTGEIPVATASVPVQAAAIGQSFSYALPAGLFTDQDLLFATTPAIVAGTYVSDHGGSFVVQTNGSYSYAPAGSYSGADRVYVPFTVGTAQPLQLPYDFMSSGSISSGTVSSGLAPRKDVVTITARLANGSPLPSWLSFNGTTFAGTPASGDAGPLAIEIVATDAAGHQTVTPFAIRVGTTNSAPVAGAVPALAAIESEAFSYTLPAGVFVDSNPHDRLSVSATLADGSPLPSWLAFDGSTLSGTPANANVGGISVRFTATDIYGDVASITTSLTVQNVNEAPAAGAAIANQLATQGQAFAFAVPASSFVDPDAGTVLNLTATRDTGEPLPSWLNFANGVFSGTPADLDTGLLRLRVTATDQGGLSTYQEFVIGIVDTNDAPTVAQALSTVNASVGGATVFRIPSSLFSDADDDGYAVSVTMADGSTLPSWIAYDPNNDTISFYPGTSLLYGKDAAAATISLKITATDPRGGTASTLLTANVVAPVVSSTITGTGSNSIVGTNASERIDSGPGNNAITGGGGVDRIVFGRGSGQDSLARGNDSSPYPLGDIVEFGANVSLADLAFSRIDDIGGSADSGKHLLIKINGTTDQLKINQQFGGFTNEEPTVREFLFADGSRLSAAQVQAMFASSTSGNDLVRGGNQGDTLTGGVGDDIIYGFDGDDVIDGGTGNDRLFGDQPLGSSWYGGSDTFLFDRGSGNDIIFADNPSSMTLDHGIFLPSSGTDTLRFGPSITVSDLIVTHLTGYPDESQLLAGQDAGSLLIQIAGTGDSVKIDHQFYLRYFNNQLDVPSLRVFQGQVNTLGIERFEFADGTVMNRAQFESLITLAPTTSGDDLIAGGAGADRLVGGAGNDILVGEDGSDTYVYNMGDGNDRILETMQVSRATPASSPSQRAGDIVSTDAISFGPGIRPEDIVFTRPDADGENLVISFKNQPGSITIEGQFRNIWHGGDVFGPNNVTSYFGTENAAIDEFRFADGTKWTLADIYAFSRKATSGNDVIDGFFRSSETLDGGAGNDLLVGRNGDDTYVFGRGYGNDTIKEFGKFYSDGTTSGQLYTANDKIKFVGVASTDVTTGIGAGGSFVFRINDTGETLTIRPESEFYNFTSIIFSDTTWTAAQFQARWTVNGATSGDDVINGMLGNDVISGGDGNDVLQGGQNLYTPQTGYGFDTLNGGAGNDTLTLESSDNDVANGDDGDDTFKISMTLSSAGDGNSSYAYMVDANRGRLDYPSFVAYGTERGVIDGGLGTDKLVLGGKLADYWRGTSYVTNNGDGSYSFKGGLRVKNVETLQFADATLAFASIAAATSQYRPGATEGTAGNDVMNGTAGNDALYGLDGNDTLNGLDGDDFLIGGAGTDSYNGGNGTDIVEYSYDTLGWSINLSTGQATQSTITETLTSIEGAYGSAAADTITGSGNADIIAGGGGDDTIAAGGGNDFIDFEGSSNGFDAIDGGAGTDTIRAISNNAVIGLASITGIETITANGFSGVYIQGSDAANTLDFSAVSMTGIARIEAGAGNDTVTGTTAGDMIVGGAGDDTLNGGDGNDVFTMSGTSDGFDAVNGGNGSDQILAGGSNTRIGLTSISGVETISANGFSGVYIQGSTAANTLDFTNVTLTGVTRIDGGSGNDVITGSAAADVILGSAGDDTLNGGLGDDVFQFSGSTNGFDLVNGGAGANSIVAMANSTVIGLSGLSGVQTITAGSFTGVSIGGSANGDTLDFSGTTLTGIIKIDGGSGNDTITGSSASDTILGSAGDDLLLGAGGDDIFQYTGSANGFDVVDGGSGTDIITALAANTVVGLSSVTGVETISAGGFSGVTIAGSGNADTLNFNGMTLTGITSINGGVGNDVITGSSATDVIFGGADNDMLNGGAGDDTLNGGAGTNSLDGGDGTDVAQYSGTAGSYSVSSNGNGTYAVVGSGISDTIVNIENLNFSDGTFTVASRVGLGLTLTGTAAAETLSGGGNNDVITGLGGDDTLNGNGGDDQFRVTGTGDGFDIIDGGAGTDTVIATVANATIGITSITGIEAISSGGFSGVSILGSSGANVLNFASVTLTGITKLDGGAGNDTITGSSAADTILGSGGDDALNGGDGNDTFQYTGSANGFDGVDGGLGTDTIAVLANSTVIGLSSITGIETITAGSFTGVSISGSANADTLDFSSTTLTGISKIDGGSGNDVITGSAAADTILGSAGDDTINAGGGNDTIQFTGTTNGFDAIDGGAGTDTISALANSTVIGLSALTGVETITAGSFTGVYITGSGNADTLDFTSVTLTNIGRVEGGAGNDTIIGNTAANTLWGGLGNDILDGGAGNDSLVGDDGDDILKGGAGTDTINGGVGTDTVDYSAYTTNLTVNLATTTAQTVTTGDSDTITNVENVTGGSGTDTLTGSTLANVLNGGGGNDRLTGGAGNDTIIGGAGTSDVAVFAGLQASYTIATNAGVVTITDNQPSTDGNDGVDTVSGIEKAEFKGGAQVGITSPIVLDLNGNGVTLLDNRNTNVAFDWDGDGRKDQTGWVGKDDGFLMIDRDGNGTVSNAGELSFTSDKPNAKSDLDGLRAFDSNNDGILSGADDRFDQFKIWQDRNGNGRADRNEVMSLSDAGVASINLAGEAVNRNWAWGENMTINTGAFTRTDGSAGAFGDVALNYAPAARLLPGNRFSPQMAAIQAAASRLSEVLTTYGADRGVQELGSRGDWMERRDHIFAASQNTSY